jgi:hypothetical protein
MGHRAHPERLAWLVLLTSFALFIIIVLGARSAVRWFLDSATIEAPVSIEIVAGGTVLVQRAGSDQPVGVVRGPFPLRVGDRVRTDANSRALIVFPDRSTAELRPETTLTILDARAGRFRSERLNLRLRIETGRARFNVALPVELERAFVVEAPGTMLDLDEGSYLVELGREGIELVAYHGGGRVHTPKATFSLLGGERVVLRDEGAPIGPVPLGKDLMTNGDFIGGIDGLEFWIVRPLPEGAEPDEVRVVPSENGRRALHIVRQSSARVYERAVTQPLDHDVADAQVLELTLDAKIAATSISGGNDEPRAPLAVSIKYRDVSGREQTWTQRFIVDGEAPAPPGTTDVEVDTWFRFQQDLLQSESGPRPIHLYELSLIVAGRAYDVWIEQVRLVAR